MRTDAILRPVGPEPPAVYWRRRAAVLGGALVVLLALRSCSGGTDSTAPEGSGASPSPAGARATTSAPPTAPAVPGGSGTPTPAPGTASSTPSGASPSPGGSPPAAAGACAAAALRVTADADQRVYAADARPRLTLSVVNGGAAPCTADLGQAQRELRVLSGDDRVWSSDDCAPGGRPEPRVLQPGQPVAFAVTWSRTRSRPGCPDGREAASPGTYRVVGRIGGVESRPAVFELR